MIVLSLCRYHSEYYPMDILIINNNNLIVEEVEKEGKIYSNIRYGSKIPSARLILVGVVSCTRWTGLKSSWGRATSGNSQVIFFKEVRITDIISSAIPFSPFASIMKSLKVSTTCGCVYRVWGGSLIWRTTR